MGFFISDPLTFCRHFLFAMLCPYFLRFCNFIRGIFAICPGYFHIYLYLCNCNIFSEKDEMIFACKKNYLVPHTNNNLLKLKFCWISTNIIEVASASHDHSAFCSTGKEKTESHIFEIQNDSGLFTYNGNECKRDSLLWCPTATEQHWM